MNDVSYVSVYLYLLDKQNVSYTMFLVFESFTIDTLFPFDVWSESVLLSVWFLSFDLGY